MTVTAASWCTNRNKHAVRCPNVLKIGREAEAPLLDIARNQRLEPRLINRDLTSIQTLNFASVYIQANDICAKFGKTGTGH